MLRDVSGSIAFSRRLTEDVRKVLLLGMPHALCGPSKALADPFPNQFLNLLLLARRQDHAKSEHGSDRCRCQLSCIRGLGIWILRYECEV